MTSALALLSATSTVLLAIGCGSSSSSPSTVTKPPEAGADGGDAGTIILPKRDSGARDATSDVTSVHPNDGGKGDGGKGDGGTGDAATGPTDARALDAGPIRKLTTRALLPTAVNDLLIDPFMTSDTSWGHFRAVVPTAEPADTGAVCPYLTREIMSESPAGVAGPAVLVNATVLPPLLRCAAILAPFAGSTEPVNAQVWVSLDSAAGVPLVLPTAGDAGVTDAGATTLAASLSVTLIPNVVPSAAAVPSFPLVPIGGAPRLIAGRQWVLLGLSAPVAVPEGGWFTITLASSAANLYVAAPEVVPTAAGQIHIDPRVAWQRPRTDVERGAILQYSREVIPRRPTRRRLRPTR